MVIHDTEEETFQHRGSRKRPSTSLKDRSAIAFPAWTLQTYSSVSVPIHRQAQNGCTCLSNRTQNNFTSSCSPLAPCALHPVWHKEKPRCHQVCKKRSHPRTCCPEYNSLNTWLEGIDSKLSRATCRCSYVLISKTHTYFCPAGAHIGENHQSVHLHYSQTNRSGLDNVLFRRLCPNTDSVGIKPQHLSTCAKRAGQSWKAPLARGRRLHVPFIPNLDRRPYLLIIIKRTTKRTQAKAASPTAMETWKEKAIESRERNLRVEIGTTAPPCPVNLSSGSYHLLQPCGYQL